MKLSEDEIKEGEIEAIKDAIGCEIPLDDLTLEDCCSEDLQKVLKPLSVEDRNYLISSFLKQGRELNIFGDTGDIKIVQGEIETQLEEPEKELLFPEYHTINGDLVYTLFDGTSIDVDLEGLKEAIKDHA